MTIIRKTPSDIFRDVHVFVVTFAFILCTFSVTSGHRTIGAEIQEADVIVYGATPGGVCAAIASAREGVSVILIEPTVALSCTHVGISSIRVEPTWMILG